jgi:hypothetical protein
MAVVSHGGDGGGRGRRGREGSGLGVIVVVRCGQKGACSGLLVHSRGCGFPVPSQV